jgi:hypothetical protein
VSKHAALLAHLAAGAETLATRVLGEQYADPFWLARYGEKAQRRGREDVLFHLKYVAQALEEDDPAVMASYARWLQSLLCARGMCTRHLAENFARLGRAIAALDGVDPKPAVDLLAAATEALHYADAAASGAQLRAEEVAATIATKLAADFSAAAERATTDAIFLVDYAADAIALGGPKTFDAHAEWLPGFLAEQGAPAGYADALIAAVRGAYFT